MKTKKDQSSSNLENLHNSTISALKDKLSSSKKDLSKRMSVAGELQPNAVDMSQSCATLSHAVSMPALTCSSCSQQRQEVDRLRLDNSKLRRELKSTKALLECSLKSEKALRDRLASEAQKQMKLSEKFEDVSLGNNRPTALIQQYGALYSQTRVDALDSLDSLPQLADLENLKNKLLFSVIVLSFRQCQQKVQHLKEKALSMFGIPKTKLAGMAEKARQSLEQSMSTYLRMSVDWYDMKPLTQEIQTSIYSTLYDYPCLKQCSKLRVYIEECVQIAWKLSVQNPPCNLEFDCKKYSSNKHIRFHSSNGDCEQIKSYVWPALLDSKTGVCLHKGMVLT